jgi:D-proline reductase (dithiol) PrdB
VEREIQEPTWGDPSYRRIPVDIESDQLGASHLHINTKNVLEDVNILLPIHRFDELVEDGHIGGLSKSAYSFMGYQGFPPDTSDWETIYGPRLAEELKAEQVSCVLLTPA